MKQSTTLKEVSDAAKLSAAKQPEYATIDAFVNDRYNKALGDGKIPDFMSIEDFKEFHGIIDDSPDKNVFTTHDLIVLHKALTIHRPGAKIGSIPSLRRVLENNGLTYKPDGTYSFTQFDAEVLSLVSRNLQPKNVEEILKSKYGLEHAPDEQSSSPTKQDTSFKMGVGQQPVVGHADVVGPELTRAKKLILSGVSLDQKIRLFEDLIDAHEKKNPMSAQIYTQYKHWSYDELREAVEWMSFFESWSVDHEPKVLMKLFEYVNDIRKNEYTSIAEFPMFKRLRDFLAARIDRTAPNSPLHQTSWREWKNDELIDLLDGIEEIYDISKRFQRLPTFEQKRAMKALYEQLRSIIRQVIFEVKSFKLA